jgi:hypothetical protein
MRHTAGRRTGPSTRGKNLVRSLPAALKPGPEHNIGATVEQRAEQRRVLGQVVLKVRVLDDNGGKLAHGREACPQRCSLARVAGLRDEADARVIDLSQQTCRTVSRGVVHDDELTHEIGRHHRRNDPLDRRRLVVAGHHDRQDPLATTQASEKVYASSREALRNVR